MVCGILLIFSVLFRVLVMGFEMIRMMVVMMRSMMVMIVMSSCVGFSF